MIPEFVCWFENLLHSTDTSPSDTWRHCFLWYFKKWNWIQYLDTGSRCLQGQLGVFCFSSPFQMKIFPLAPLSRMKQSSRSSSSWPNGLFSDTLVMVMEPVASDTCREKMNGVKGDNRWTKDRGHSTKIAFHSYSIQTMYWPHLCLRFSQRNTFMFCCVIHKQRASLAESTL